MQAIQIHPADDVAVALEPVHAGDCIRIGATDVIAVEDIPQGHKFSLHDMLIGKQVFKYGQPIGCLTANISAGSWVHTHNLATNLNDTIDYVYEPSACELPSLQPETFQGFRRADGKVGIRNEIWIIPTVACINGIARELQNRASPLITGSITNICCFEHPFGCSQVGEDLDQTTRILTGLARHPNAGGVLVLSLGCENLTQDIFKKHLGSYDERRIEFVTCQDHDDEVQAGMDALERLISYASKAQRETIPASELVVGLECGGSDGLSGITANPVIGRVSDGLVARGATSVLAEVPEMFGGESFLFNRCKSQAVFDDAVRMVDSFKNYFLAQGTPIYENPSPGNRAGGITTLEEKSCGCVQKSGTGPISDVVSNYGEAVHTHGLVLYNTPGNDSSSVTGLAAAGCQIILFSTGRGTPFEAPVPTIKISSNTELASKKSGWIDFDAGVVATGARTMEQAGCELYTLMLEIASGKRTKSEARSMQSIAIWKMGVTL